MKVAKQNGFRLGDRVWFDRGYDADWIRGLAMRRGAWANIPPKRNRSNPINFSPYLYRDRNRIECLEVVPVPETGG